jgi:hypothetical protein
VDLPRKADVAAPHGRIVVACAILTAIGSSLLPSEASLLEEAAAGGGRKIHSGGGIHSPPLTKP